ncbi:hypothetical protein LPJ60_006262, partial [Coemansia sp. RSA 2675]
MSKRPIDELSDLEDVEEHQEAPATNEVASPMDEDIDGLGHESGGSGDDDDEDDEEDEANLEDQVRRDISSGLVPKNFVRAFGDSGDDDVDEYDVVRIPKRDLTT